MQVLPLLNFNGSKSLLCHAIYIYKMKVRVIKIQVFMFNEDMQIIRVPKVHMPIFWYLDIIEMFLICMWSWE